MSGTDASCDLFPFPTDLIAAFAATVFCITSRRRSVEWSRKTQASRGGWVGCMYGYALGLRPSSDDAE